MNALNTATVSLAVTPTVLSTFVSHYLNRKPLHERPTAHLSYDEGLHLIRSFLSFASLHTVEELQAFTSQWVPHPQWIKVEEVEIPGSQLTHAADALEVQLGPDGIRKVGGRKWWQWRKHSAPLKAEWIEMRSDFNERKKNNDSGRRIMLYVHGGAYFFGSVDEHRYQMQRHARKLKARVFAPKYRLSPQFPFPCGLQDCLAAYLYLLTVQAPNTIVLAGDSAGGGMVMSMLVIMRDQGIPLPAGAILISPWVDLTHSFPSVVDDAPFDYIPQSGFHHKPSAAWPPPNDEELDQLKKLALEEKRKKQPLSKDKGPESSQTTPSSSDIANATTHLSVDIDGKDVVIKEQIQMYTTNELLSHPLVSPVMQPTLGGLPPILVMVGGGEILRDEQIYLAHKCANPFKYLPVDTLLDEKARAQIKQYKPTDVQLQVWDDLCHVAPTLSFTRPAKYMYRSIAQFGAWALARAQKTDIDILDDDDISVISKTSSDSSAEEEQAELREQDEIAAEHEASGQIGRAGEALPPFSNHMIRQRVTRHGVIFDLAPTSTLRGCTMAANLVGVVKQGPVKNWLEQKLQWDQKFAGVKKKVHKNFIKELVEGYEGFGDGEFPPPSALAGRRKIGAAALEDKKKSRSMGLSLWSLWGSKHDLMTMNREKAADEEPRVMTATSEEGRGARHYSDLENQETFISASSGSRRTTVRDERQTNGDGEADESANGPTELLTLRDNGKSGEFSRSMDEFLTPDYHPDSDIGTSGKRPYVGGIGVPFSLNKEAETASMMTLMSSSLASPRPMTAGTMNSATGTSDAAKQEAQASSGGAVYEAGVVPAAEKKSIEGAALVVEKTSMEDAAPATRPELDTFVTAAEDLPKATGSKDI